MDVYGHMCTCACDYMLNTNLWYGFSHEDQRGKTEIHHANMLHDGNWCNELNDIQKDCSNWQNLIFQIFVFNCAFSYYLICYTSNHLDFMKMNTCIVQECKTNKIRSYDSLPEFATWIINNYYLHCAD